MIELGLNDQFDEWENIPGAHTESNYAMHVRGMRYQTELYMNQRYEDGAEHTELPALPRNHAQPYKTGGAFEETDIAGHIGAEPQLPESELPPVTFAIFDRNTGMEIACPNCQALGQWEAVTHRRNGQDVLMAFQHDHGAIGSPLEDGRQIIYLAVPVLSTVPVSRVGRFAVTAVNVAPEDQDDTLPKLGTEGFLGNDPTQPTV